jgi:2-methylthioadenine synthetase
MAVKRYFVTTFGCQMNAHDSERIKGMLEELGLGVFNTCTIREKPDTKFAAYMGDAAARKRELVHRDELRGREQVDDELDRLIEVQARGERDAGTHGLRARGAERRGVVLPVAHRPTNGYGELADVTIHPSNELSALQAESLRTVTIRRHPVRASENPSIEGRI